MSTPANIRVNIGAPFPTLVKGSTPLAISKQNGIWTVGFSFTNLPPLPASTDPTRAQILVWNEVSNVFQQVTISALQSVNPPATVITSANSPYTPNATDTFLKVDTTGGPVTINLPTAASRNNISLVVKDYKGNAAVNNITIVPQAGETIDNYTHAAPLVLNADFDGVNLFPDNGFYILAP